MKDKPSASSCIHAGSMTGEYRLSSQAIIKATHGLWKSKAPSQEQPECLLGHAGP